MAEEFNDVYLTGNELIEDAIHQFYQEQTQERLIAVCAAVKERIRQNGHLLFPVDMGEDEEGCQTFEFKMLELEGVPVMVAFTSIEEKEKGPAAGGLSNFIDSTFEPLLQMDEIGGVLLNPWGESLCLSKEDIAWILNKDADKVMCTDCGGIQPIVLPEVDECEE